jgi:hypothetical protein
MKSKSKGKRQMANGKSAAGAGIVHYCEGIHTRGKVGGMKNKAKVKCPKAASHRGVDSRGRNTFAICLLPFAF